MRGRWYLCWIACGVILWSCGEAASEPGKTQKADTASTVSGSGNNGDSIADIDPTETPTVKKINPSSIPPATTSKKGRRLGHGYEFAGNGKIKDAPLLAKVYTKTELQTSPLEKPKSLIDALTSNQKVVNRSRGKKSYSIDGLKFSRADMQKINRELLEFARGEKDLASVADFHKIHGEDKRGNVHFTGYFTPIIEVSRTQDSIYKYPIYRYPKGMGKKLPSREDIDGKKQALAGKGLELAWAKSKLEIYFLQVQGSGRVVFKDGSRQMFMFGGGNGRSYQSIGKYLVENGYVPAEKISLQAITDFFEQQPQLLDPVLFINPSYTFFRLSTEEPMGGAGVPLTALHSIASDPKYIPTGSCLLAEVPVLDEKGFLTGHEMRILVAQDRGAAIKGPGHVDFYCGEGEEGKSRSSALHHYGRIWLLLPKKDLIESTASPNTTRKP